MREVLNSVRHIARRARRADAAEGFSALAAVYGGFRRLMQRFLFETTLGVALMIDRERSGRESSPPAGAIDSEAAKSPGVETRGCDAGKKIVRRTSHFALDTGDRLLMISLTIAGSAGAQAILDAIRKRWPRVKQLFAGRGNDRRKLMDKAAREDFVTEIVRRDDAAPGFKVPPRRWVVERTFAGMTRWRRQARDYEKRIDVSHAMIRVALGGPLHRPIAHQRAFPDEP